MVVRTLGGRNADLRRAILMLLVMSATLSAGLLVFPPKALQTNFEWHPNSVDDSGNFSLDRSVPAWISISFESTSSISSERYVELVDFGHWSLARQGGEFRFTNGSGGQQSLAIEASCATGCVITVESQQGGVAPRALVTIERGESGAGDVGNLDFRPSISVLSASPEAIRAGLSISGTTRPYGLVPTGERLFIFLTALSLFAISLFLWWRIVHHHVQILAKKIKQSVKLQQVDWFVLAAILTALFIGPVFSDDQWVIETALKFSDSGVLSSEFSPTSIWLPTGTVFYAIYALAATVSTNLFILRIIPLLLLLATWVILRWLASFVGLTGAKTLWVAACSYLLFVFGWLMTLRPEPFVTFLSAVFAMCAWLYVKKENSLHVAIALCAGGLAISTHQSGLTLLFPTLGLGTYWLFKSVQDRRWPSLLGVGSVVFVFLSLSTFAIYDLREVVLSVQEWQSFSTHSLGPAEEPTRWATALSQQLPSRSVSIALSVALMVIAAIPWGFPGSRRALLSRIFFMLAAVGLLFTASKWIWHLGAIALPAVLLLAVFVEEISKKWSNGGRSRELWIASILSVTFGVIVTVATPHGNLVLVAVATLALVSIAPKGLGQLCRLRAQNTPGRRPAGRFVLLMLGVSILVNSWISVNQFTDSTWRGLPFLADRYGFRSTELFLPIESTATRDVTWPPKSSAGQPWQIQLRGQEVERFISVWVATNATPPELTLLTSGGQAQPISDYRPVQVGQLGEDSDNAWSQYVFLAPPASSQIAIKPSKWMRQKQSSGQLFVEEVFKARLGDLVEENTFYGSPYEASKYGGLSVLGSREGLWSVPDLVILDRGFADFSVPVAATNLIQVGTSPVNGAGIFLYRDEDVKNLLLETRENQ